MPREIIGFSDVIRYLFLKDHSGCYTDEELPFTLQPGACLSMLSIAREVNYNPDFWAATREIPVW